MIQKLDQYTQSGPLSESLIYSATGITRSSGPGKVTTYTKHGLPSEHTRVTWNKLELNSALNGIVDFSTLPSFLLSNQSDLGNQASETITLKSAKLTGNNTDILLQTGSFNSYNAGLKKQIILGKTSIHVGGEFVDSKSNFPYENDLKQRVKQRHGDFRQYHGTIGFAHKFSASSNLNIRALYSDISTNIPPTVFQKTSVAQQANYPLKLVADYKND